MASKSNTKDFIEKAIKVHKNKYSYDNVNYINVCTRIEIFCIKCNKFFFQRPDHHLSGSGCPICGGLKRTKSQKINTKEFIKKAIERHKDKYDYSEVNYINTKTKVKIFCKIHKKYFYQRPNGHLDGAGCSICGGTLKSNTEEFIKKAKKVHGNKYDYSEVNYKNARSKINIICSVHKKKFIQAPADHLSGKGCPLCVGTNFENNVRDILNKLTGRNFIKIRPKWLKNPKTNYPLELDCYNEDLKIAVECQGPHHYKKIKKYKMTNEQLILQKYRDQIKKKICKQKGIDLLEIKYKYNISIYEIENILKKMLNI